MGSEHNALPRSVQILLLMALITIVGFCIYTQNNPERISLRYLRDAGTIKVVIHDPHHHVDPDAPCSARHFDAHIPKLKGAKARFTVFRIERSNPDTVLDEQKRLWQWENETEFRNNRVITQAIGIKSPRPGTYRAKVTVERNGEEITVSAKKLLTIPDPEKSVAPAGTTV